MCVVEVCPVCHLSFLMAMLFVGSIAQVLKEAQVISPKHRLSIIFVVSGGTVTLSSPQHPCFRAFPPLPLRHHPAVTALAFHYLVNCGVLYE